MSFAFLVSSDFIEENKVFILPSLIVRILSLISYWFLIVSVSKSELFLISPSSSKAIFQNPSIPEIDCMVLKSFFFALCSSRDDPPPRAQPDSDDEAEEIQVGSK